MATQHPGGWWGEPVGGAQEINATPCHAAPRYTLVGGLPLPFHQRSVDFLSGSDGPVSLIANRGVEPPGGMVGTIDNAFLGMQERVQLQLQHLHQLHDRDEGNEPKLDRHEFHPVAGHVLKGLSSFSGDGDLPLALQEGQGAVLAAGGNEWRQVLITVLAGQHVAGHGFGIDLAGLLQPAPQWCADSGPPCL
jgi:hypothetical protein